jgi:hypothetical protein
MPGTNRGGSPGSTARLSYCHLGASLVTEAPQRSLLASA